MQPLPKADDGFDARLEAVGNKVSVAGMHQSFAEIVIVHGGSVFDWAGPDMRITGIMHLFVRIDPSLKARQRGDRFKN